MKLKIVSLNGKTRVIDEDTGELIENVGYVELSLGVDGVTGIIKIVNPTLDIVEEFTLTPHENTKGNDRKGGS